MSSSDEEDSLTWDNSYEEFLEEIGGCQECIQAPHRFFTKLFVTVVSGQAALLVGKARGRLLCVVARRIHRSDLNREEVFCCLG